MIFSRGGGSDYQSSTQRVTKPSQIVRSLKLLKEGHCLVNVTVPGHDETYNTAILGIYPGRELLVLDELNSRDGHEQLLKAGKLKASCRFHGVEYRFAGAVQQVDYQGGIAMYRVALPQLLLHIQRRDHYRVPVDRETDIQVNLPLTGDPRLRGHLCDLSQGGIGALFETRSSPNQGQVLPVCSLMLPNQKPIRTELEVRFARLDGQRNVLRVGGRFVNLDKEQERDLARLVAKLQREYLRKHPR